ncbi:MAG TPA: hypothetical protein VHQ43_04920 [Solirubrobacterales bacterium]|jgi:hypothetical protein|nr:hypothetical protein [Solirubrobacterales bacterium]
MSAGAELPYVDELSVEIAAGAGVVWEALLRAAEAPFRSPLSARAAGLLGCADREASGPRPLDAGSAFPGFRVARAEHASELALRGRHRFSDYALTFRLDDLAGDRTRLRAETRAAFPGLRGRAYRTLVIGTRLHVLATNRVLRAVQRRAA